MEEELKKYKVIYIADGEKKEDVWFANNARDARHTAEDDYRADYDRVRIIDVIPI